MQALDRIRRREYAPDFDKGIYLKQQLRGTLIEHKQYIDTDSEDLPEIRPSTWGATNGRDSAYARDPAYPGQTPERAFTMRTTQMIPVYETKSYVLGSCETGDSRGCQRTSQHFEPEAIVPVRSSCPPHVSARRKASRRNVWKVTV